MNLLYSEGDEYRVKKSHPYYLSVGIEAILTVAYNIYKQKLSEHFAYQTVSLGTELCKDGSKIISFCLMLKAASNISHRGHVTLFTYKGIAQLLNYVTT